MKKKHLFIIIATLFVTGLSIFLWPSQGEVKATTLGGYPPTKVALASVVLMEAPRVFTGIGQLEAERQVQVSSEVSGQVTSITFESGQRVTKGQRLIQLNDAVEQAEKMRLVAERRNAEIQQQRFSRLVKENAASREQLDNSVAALDMVIGSLQRIDALIAQKSIRAPFEGLMGIRHINMGQYLTSGASIANLVNSDILYANFALDETVSPELYLGQSVMLKVDAFSDEVFAAKISAIDPIIGETRMIQVQATLDQSQEKLKPGMYVNVNVRPQILTSVLTLPETAITYTIYGDSVFIAQLTQEGLVAKRISVQVGARWQGRVEIIKGVAIGDQVVTTGQLKLRDGASIVALERDTLNAPLRKDIPEKLATSLAISDIIAQHYEVGKE